MKTNNSMSLNKRIRQRLNHMIEMRKSWLNECEEISKNIVPERGQFGHGNKRKYDRSSQYNSRPDKYLHNLSSILQSGLTSPARPWFKLVLPDVDMNEWGPAKDWLSQVENTFQKLFKTSNFYPAIYSAYTELAAFGCASMGSWEDVRSSRIGEPQFNTYTAGEWMTSRNSNGEIDAVSRNVFMTAEEAFERWGSRCSKYIKELANKNPYETVNIIHLVERRKNYDQNKKDKYNMPYSSIWIEETALDDDNGGILSEGGFLQMPYHIVRWNAVSNEPYATGPGHKAVKDAKSLNLLDQIATYGLNKVVNPPILVPSHLNIKLNNAPGGITFFTGNAGENQIKPLYTIESDLSVALTFMNRWEEILKETLQNDLFIFFLNRSNITATEIYERNQEKLLLLGPVLERIQTELLMPMFERMYYILSKNELIPAPPADLVGLDLRPEFVGLLAQAQKISATQGIRDIASFTSQLASVSNKAIDKIDIDQTIDVYSSMLGVPNGVIRSDDETKKIRDEELRANQQAAIIQSQNEQLKQIVGYAQTLSKIDTNKQSALTELLGLK